MEIKRPEDYKVLFIGGEQLKKDTADLVKSGGAEFIEASGDEAKALLDGHPELQGDLAIVSEKNGAQGEACLISCVGESLIIHCEDKVLPVKDPADAVRITPASVIGRRK